MWSVGSLDGESKELVKQADLPADLLEDANNLFSLLNILHFQTGKVYSTRHPLTGKKLIAIREWLGPSSETSLLSIITDNRSDQDVIACSDPVALVAKGHVRPWMKDFDANILTH